MLRVRVWALESDYDAKTVESLANKLVTYLSLKGVSIESSGKTAIPKPRGRSHSPSDSLRKAVQNYLRDDDYVIFVFDTDSPMSIDKRRRESNSLFNQVEQVRKDRGMRERVFLVQAVQELEAWLLTDCLGIFCYFTGNRPKFRRECRKTVLNDNTCMKIVEKYQKGDTQLIIEAEIGGKGPKEHLKRFSEDILLGLNPNMSKRNVGDNRYRERMSPEIAKHVVIDSETLNRNASLRKLGILLSRLR